MPCIECRDLTSHAFRTADDLINAVRLAAEEVDRGVLARAEVRSLAPHEQEALDSSIASGALPSRVHYRFRCETCFDLFTLEAETNTGTGSWLRDGDA